MNSLKSSRIQFEEECNYKVLNNSACVLGIFHFYKYTYSYTYCTFILRGNTGHPYKFFSVPEFHYTFSVLALLHAKRSGLPSCSLICLSASPTRSLRVLAQKFLCELV